MQLITVKLVHADGRILKVNANEVPVWNLKGFNIPKEGKTSGGEPRKEQPAKDKPEPEFKDDSLNDVLI